MVVVLAIGHCIPRLLWDKVVDKLNMNWCRVSVSVDNVRPVITCPDSIVREVRAGNLNGETVTWTNATATDNSGVVQTVVLTSDAQRRSGTFFAFGSYTITYTATDGSGNSASCSFTVTVGEFWVKPKLWRNSMSLNIFLYTFSCVAPTPNAWNGIFLNCFSKTNNPV